jgi:hypothetical protein
MGMRSNCWIEARLEYWARKRRWRRDPDNAPRPYLMKRPSFASPHVEHWLVGTYDPEVDAVRPSSFKPESPRASLRWWQLPRVLFFRGKWVRGDTQHADLEDGTKGHP